MRKKQSAKKNAKHQNKDQMYYEQFTKHMKNLRSALEYYRKNHSHPEKVLDAYRSICEDALGKNRLTRDLAKAIVETFQNFPLKIGPKGRHHTAHSFLLDFELGKIEDPRELEKGMNGVCSNLGLTIMRMYDPEEISSEIKNSLP